MDGSSTRSAISVPPRAGKMKALAERSKPIDALGRPLDHRFGAGPRIPIDQRVGSAKPARESKAARRMRRAARR